MVLADFAPEILAYLARRHLGSEFAMAAESKEKVEPDLAEDDEAEDEEVSIAPDLTLNL